MRESDPWNYDDERKKKEEEKENDSRSVYRPLWCMEIAWPRAQKVKEKKAENYARASLASPVRDLAALYKPESAKRPTPTKTSRAPRLRTGSACLACAASESMIAAERKLRRGNRYCLPWLATLTSSCPDDA